MAYPLKPHTPVPNTPLGSKQDPQDLAQPHLYHLNISITQATPPAMHSQQEPKALTSHIRKPLTWAERVEEEAQLWKGAQRHDFMASFPSILKPSILAMKYLLQ